MAQRRLALGVVWLALLGSSVWAEYARTARLVPGTRHETTLHLKQGAGTTPSIMVIGGLHGDERAGYMAARRLLDWEITRGMLVIIPEAYVDGIARNVRGELNGMLPGNARGNPLERLAAAVWYVIDFYRPGLLLTLHESVEFHAVDPKRYGQTLCHDFTELNPFMRRVLGRVNPDIAEPLHRFRIFVEPHPNCPTCLAGSRLGIPATSIETCRKLPVEQRVSHQLMVLMAFFDECGLGYEPVGVPRLSTASQPPGTQLRSGKTWAE